MQGVQPAGFNKNLCVREYVIKNVNHELSRVWINSLSTLLHENT